MATSAAAIPTASRPAALTASPGCVRRVRTDLKTSENRFLGGHHHHQLRQQHCHTLLASSAPPATATYLRWQGKGINPAKLSHITNLLPRSLCLQRQTARTRHTPVEPLQAAGSASAANRKRLGQQFALHAQWRLRWSQAQQHSRFQRLLHVESAATPAAPAAATVCHSVGLETRHWTRSWQRGAAQLVGRSDVV